MSIGTIYRKNTLVIKLLVALVLGVVAGAAFGDRILVIKPLGSIFLNLLKLVALPLIIVNLISGISALGDPKAFGRIGVKILLYYAATTIIAIILGFVTGTLLKPGIGFTLTGKYDAAIAKVPSFLDTLVGLLPGNIFQTLTEGRLDQIVVFSAIVGIAVLFLKPEQKEILTKFFDSLAQVFNKIIAGILVYAPVGIFSLAAVTVAVYGKILIGFLVKYLGASYLGILLQIVVYAILLTVFTKVPLTKFFQKAGVLIITAISTSSSLAVVPVNLSVADELDVPRSISSFTIPLGAQVNKDGNGLMLAITFLFAAQAVGAPLPLPVFIKAIVLALILTTGAGGVPGGGIVSIAVIIDAFGLPLEVVGIVSGIFALIDMGYTTLNVLGDLVGTVIVSQSENRSAPSVAIPETKVTA
ncbi:MAG: dicarboxylate/amino acid:cation symporter [Fusobacteriaceae bacterium]|jgi:Na+/H+-dicarboxylate symporter|nr:dicarboxylate/amino acid:cation symporter [Fusobacteriaceae bacterium]